MANESGDIGRILLVVISVLVLVPVIMMAVMVPMMGLWGWGHMADGGMWGGTGGGWVWLLAWLVVLLVLGGGGYLLVRAIGRDRADPADSALQELRLAYARGDLTDEEFEERRERLTEE